MVSGTIFKIQNLDYSYPGGEIALRDINMTIGRGERVALVGANGCGKSTLLKIMDGLLFPQRGCIEVWGEMLSEHVLVRDEAAFSFRRRVGFLFQNSDAQLFNSNVWDEIAFGPVQLGFDSEKIRRRVEDVLSLLEIEHLRDRPPFKLSGGEKKKVALASVLSINPEVLLLDEPTIALDPRTQGWLVEMLLELNRAGKTIITATHDLPILPVIADKIIVLNEAHRLVAEGSPVDVLADHEVLARANLINKSFHEHRHPQYAHLHAH